MTPGTESVVATKSEFVVPNQVVLVEGGISGMLTWTNSLPETGHYVVRLGGLLEDFLALERATPDEMVSFLETYGVPELCHHGVPDRHERARSTGYCPMAVVEDGKPALGITSLHRVARAFAAASRLGVALAARTPGETQDWVDLQLAQRWSWSPSQFESDEWRDRRALLAYWMTKLLRDCGVQALTRWTEGGRMTVTPEADGLMGTIALALAYDIGQREGYVCSVCATPVDRVRPPLAGEAVYCNKPACKREQQRLNQRRYRERKRAEERD
jgi:hypothetical protein